MRNEDFYELVRKAREEQDVLLNVKGADYADQGVFGNEKLANFKEVARRLQGAPLDATTICAVYWLKHVIAIERWVRDRKVSSEPIEGRFDDESNYNLLLRANAQEYQAFEESVPPAEVYEGWHEAECEDISCIGCALDFIEEDPTPPADPINEVTRLTEGEEEYRVAGEPEAGTHRTCGCHALGLNCYCGINEEEEEDRMDNPSNEEIIRS